MGGAGAEGVGVGRLAQRRHRCVGAGRVLTPSDRSPRVAWVAARVCTGHGLQEWKSQFSRVGGHATHASQSRSGFSPWSASRKPPARAKKPLPAPQAPPWWPVPARIATSFATPREERDERRHEHRHRTAGGQLHRRLNTTAQPLVVRAGQKDFSHRWQRDGGRHG